MTLGDGYDGMGHMMGWFFDGSTGWIYLILGVVADNFPQGIFAMLTVSVIYAVIALLTTVAFYFINRKKFQEETPENL